jgi:hypothetical protein
MERPARLNLDVDHHGFLDGSSSRARLDSTIIGIAPVILNVIVVLLLMSLIFGLSRGGLKRLPSEPYG